MTNLKKIGLSALAGSLVAFSANAVEMSVTGTAEVTYTTSDGSGSAPTGNPWGSNTAISFSGSGDVGFGTAKIVRTLQDGANHGTHADNFVSAWQTVDMGAMGKLSFDSAGGGLEGVTAYDDLLPTAYEEVWNGVGSGTSLNAGAASNDTLGYSNSFGAFGISLAVMSYLLNEILFRSFQSLKGQMTAIWHRLKDAYLGFRKLSISKSIIKVDKRIDSTLKRKEMDTFKSISCINYEYKLAELASEIKNKDSYVEHYQVNRRDVKYAN